MKRRYYVLWITIGIAAVAIAIPKLIRRLEEMAIPEGWEKAIICINHVLPCEGGYTYTLCYQYKEGDVYKSIEHHTIDDGRPKEGQCLRGAYKKNEPAVFDLLQEIKYE